MSGPVLAAAKIPHLAGMLAAALLTLAAAPAMAADPLSLTGLAGQRLTLTADEFAALPHVTLTVSVEGKTSTYQGVPLTQLLQRVGAPTGKSLHGAELADVVVINARDGYVVALALAETDPTMRGQQIILADRADGKPLNDASGPYRLVVQGDLRGARSARMVTTIAVVRVAAAAR